MLSQKTIRLARHAIILAGGLWLAISLFIVALIQFHAARNNRHPADVIVILAWHSDRGAHAADLYRQGYADTILCNGGDIPNEPERLSTQCRNYLIDEEGIPAEAIVEEPYSLSTEEHAIFLKPMMARYGWHDALVVSDGFHLFRASWVFDQYGITTYTSAVPKNLFGLITDIPPTIREILAIQWHAFKTVFNLPFTRVDGVRPRTQTHLPEFVASLSDLPVTHTLPPL